MIVEIIFTEGGLAPSDYEVENFYEHLILPCFTMGWTKEDTVITKEISSQTLLTRIRLGLKNNEIKAENLRVKVDNLDGTFTEAKLCQNGLVGNCEFWEAGGGILNQDLRMKMELI